MFFHNAIFNFISILQLYFQHPEIGGQTCVVVEFDRTEDCQMAYKTLGKKAREENSGWEYNLLGKVLSMITV